MAAGKIRSAYLSGPSSGRGWRAGRSRGAFLRSWIPGTGPGAASAALKPEAQARQDAPHCPALVPAGRRQEERRERRGTTYPRGGIPRAARRRRWEGAGREVVPGARPRMLAAPAAAAAALGAAPGLGRSLRAPLGSLAGNGDARSGRGLGRAVPACAA